MYLAGGVNMFFDRNTTRGRDMTAKSSFDSKPSVCGVCVDDTIIFRFGVLADTDTVRRVAVARHHVQYGARKSAGTPRGLIGHFVTLWQVPWKKGQRL